ncbi:ABC transporter permease [Methylococcus sp. EFPC2]|nr:ABC transporter permease [Methylococcus sp. EFPC2]
MHAHTCVASLGRMYRTPVASGMTILVIAIALALPASFHVLVKNARQASGALEISNQISLFLKPELADEAGKKLAESLGKHPDIALAELITKEAGLKEFQTYSGFGDALRALDFNPLPAVVSILPKATLTQPEQIERLAEELRGLSETDYVQIDMDWLRKLRAIITIAQRGSIVLGILLGTAVLFIVANTIRLELQDRREEIAVTRLMGATHRFIRRPFLYTGLWYGLLGGIIAWLLVSFTLLLLNGPVRELSTLYGGGFELAFLSLEESAWLIALATALGIGGSWAVVQHHLNLLEDDERNPA